MVDLVWSRNCWLRSSTWVPVDAGPVRHTIHVLELSWESRQVTTTKADLPLDSWQRCAAVTGLVVFHLYNYHVTTIYVKVVSLLLDMQQEIFSLLQNMSYCELKSLYSMWICSWISTINQTHCTAVIPRLGMWVGLPFPGLVSPETTTHCPPRLPERWLQMWDPCANAIAAVGAVWGRDHCTPLWICGNRLTGDTGRAFNLPGKLKQFFRLMHWHNFLSNNF